MAFRGVIKDGFSWKDKGLVRKYHLTPFTFCKCVSEVFVIIKTDVMPILILLNASFLSLITSRKLMFKPVTKSHSSHGLVLTIHFMFIFSSRSVGTNKTEKDPSDGALSVPSLGNHLFWNLTTLHIGLRFSASLITSTTVSELCTAQHSSNRELCQQTHTLYKTSLLQRGRP